MSQPGHPGYPAYLEPVSGNEPTEGIRCPIHGFIYYSKHERNVIDHWTFQRLRHIKQLALNHYVYPGAVHTRFEHSLGVMELATRAFDGIARRHPTVLQAHFEQIPLFERDTMARVRQFVRLFALLHDVGHTAFSHAGERYVTGGRHEAISGEVVSSPDLLGSLLDETYFEGLAEHLRKLIVEEKDIHPNMRLIKRLISGQMDFDRTDYLLRDSYHVGVEYGRFDVERLIDSLTVVEDPIYGLDIALKRGGIHMFEALILARYQMNTQVYYHRIRRLFDIYLRRFLDMWALGQDAANPAERRYQPDALRKFLMYDDHDLMAEIKRAAHGYERAPAEERQAADDWFAGLAPELRENVHAWYERPPEELTATEPQRTVLMGKWASRIHNRRLHHMVWESSDHADERLKRHYDQVLDYIGQRFPDLEVLPDDSPGSIHKIYVRLYGEGSEAFYVVDSQGVRRSITEESPIIDRMPTRFRILRIFVDAPDKARLQGAVDEIREFSMRLS